AAHGAAGTGVRSADVFLYQMQNNKTLAQLLPGIASVRLIGGGTIRFQVGRRRADPDLKIVLDSEDVVPGPEPRGFWDIDLESRSGRLLSPHTRSDKGSVERTCGIVQHDDPAY